MQRLEIRLRVLTVNGLFSAVQRMQERNDSATQFMTVDYLVNQTVLEKELRGLKARG